MKMRFVQFLFILVIFSSCQSNEAQKSLEITIEKLKNENDSLRASIKKFDLGYWSDGIGVYVDNDPEVVGIDDTVKIHLSLFAVLNSQPMILQSDTGKETRTGLELFGKIDTAYFDPHGHGEVIAVPTSTGRSRRYFKVIGTTKNNKKFDLYAISEFGVVEQSDIQPLRDKVRSMNQ